MKFRAPELYITSTQFTAHPTTSTSVTPGAPCPVKSALSPTSFVPIHRVYIVSSWFNFSVPFATSAKYVGSWLSKTDGAGRNVMLFEHVAPDLANGKSAKLPSCAAKTGHMMPPSA